MKRGKAAGRRTPGGRQALLRQQAEGIAREKAGRNLENLDTLSPAAAQRLLHDLQVHQIELELQNEELRQMQDALEASRVRYFGLYNLAPVGYFTLDDKGFIIEANLTSATLLGVPRGVFSGKPLSRFVAGGDADKFYLHYRRLLATREPQSFELLMSREGGAPFCAWVETRIFQNEGGIVSCQVVISDVDELNLIRQQLRRSQSLQRTAGKIAMVGGWSINLPQQELVWSEEIFEILEYPPNGTPTLAEALALYPPPSHKIITTALNACIHQGIPFDCELEIFTLKRRPLHVRAIGHALRDAQGKITLGNVELARQDARANWQALVSLDEIQKAGMRAKELVQQILSFSRRQPTLRRMMSLPSVVEEAVRLLRTALPEGASMDYFCAPDVPSILADPTQIQQLLLNLGNNAAYAMRGRSGSINIRVEGITLDQHAAGVASRLRPGRYACIVMSDTGKGMDEAIRQRIFEPFFTTKPHGEGTGLGLSVAQSIVQSHEGTIVVSSEPGQGSRFEVYFPCARETETVLAMTEPAGVASEGNGRRILYIEDDEAQLFMIRRMLERWGYRVSAHIEQREALRALQAGEHFDLVITDYNMPGLSGLEAACAIRAARPELPIIMLSGYITQKLRVAAAAAGVDEVLAKPGDIEGLRDVVQGLLMKPMH
ncbi:MAG: sensory box protein [Proteobacteria bacterium]|nr:sensory box protein [Pseudomonadota bacterium]